MSRFLLILVLLFGAWLFIRIRQQPDHFQLERKRLINASPNQLKALLADFSKDAAWNPFMQGDPSLHYQISDKPSGIGAQMSWQGKRSGSGHSEIIEVSAAHVKRSLTMLKPMKAENIVTFTFDISGDQTLLTWRMSGPLSGAQKFFQTIISSEKMIGGAFDQGLDQIEAYFKE